MDPLRVKPDSDVRLSDIDPRATPGFKGGKARGEAELLKLRGRLAALQEVLYAEHEQKILIVLQGMDTSGKDGVIRHVFEGVNPQGVRTCTRSRCRARRSWTTTSCGASMRRSRGAASSPCSTGVTTKTSSSCACTSSCRKRSWKKRYDQINEFETILTDTGTTVLKFFLHIDREEQKERLQARLDEPDKRWKFNVGDLEERKLWDEYQRAYEDVLSRTSTARAPWYVVPANRKWYRNLAVARTIVATLEELKMAFPPAADLTGVVVD